MRTKIIAKKTDKTGRNISIIQKYDETAICEGVFVVIDKEEIEFSFLSTATTFYNDIH